MPSASADLPKVLPLIREQADLNEDVKLEITWNKLAVHESGAKTRENRRQRQRERLRGEAELLASYLNPHRCQAGFLSRNMKKGVHTSTLKGQNKQFIKCPSYSWFRHIDFYKHLSWCPSHNLIAPLNNSFISATSGYFHYHPSLCFPQSWPVWENIYFLETSVEQWP